jgi:hypothetical protein
MLIIHTMALIRALMLTQKTISSSTLMILRAQSNTEAIHCRSQKGTAPKEEVTRVLTSSVSATYAGSGSQSKKKRTARKASLDINSVKEDTKSARIDESCSAPATSTEPWQASNNPDEPSVALLKFLANAEPTMQTTNNFLKEKKYIVSSGDIWLLNMGLLVEMINIETFKTFAHAYLNRFGNNIKQQKEGAVADIADRYSRDPEIDALVALRRKDDALKIAKTKAETDVQILFDCLDESPKKKLEIAMKFKSIAKEMGLSDARELMEKGVRESAAHGVQPNPYADEGMTLRYYTLLRIGTFFLKQKNKAEDDMQEIARAAVSSQVGAFFSRIATNIMPAISEADSDYKLSCLIM